MQCPVCNSRMYALPDRHGQNKVFQCPCGFQSIKSPRGENGTRWCPVCGTGLEMIYSLSGLSDYYSCPTCSDEVERRLSERPGLRQHLVGHREPFPLGLKIGVFLLVCILVLSTVSMIVDAKTREEVLARITGDPVFDRINVPQNVGTDNQSVLTVMDQWLQDVPEPPNGTYYGTFLAGSGFKHNNQGYWRPDDIPGTGRFTFWMVGAHFNWTPQTLMTGTSEWWLMIPVQADSFEATWGFYLCVWESADLSTLGWYAPNYYSYVGHVRPSLDGLVPRDLISYNFECDPTSDFGRPATQGHGDVVVANNHVYVRARAILKPGTDYVLGIMGRLPEKGYLTTIWTGAERPAGNRSVICFGDYRITHLANNTRGYQMTGQKNQLVNLDLAWSFIFCQGIGEGGLFGSRVSIEPGTWLMLYPFLNTTIAGTRYASFMLPWISDDEFNITLYVTNSMEQSPPINYHMWQWDSPAPAGTFTWNGSINWTYQDFCLFSTNWPLDFTDPDHPFLVDDQWNVRVELEFHTCGNLTLLCYEPTYTPTLWSDVGAWETNTTKWPFARPTIFSPSMGLSFLDYGVYCSAWGTFGQWAIRELTASGHGSYTYNFPNRIILSSAEWVLMSGDRSVSLSPAEKAWLEFQDLWGRGHYIQAIGAGIKAAVLYIWEGTSKIVGYLKDGLSATWEGMKTLGQWIYTHLVQFYEWISSVLEDLADLLVDFWDLAKYIVAPLGLMLTYGVGSRALRKYARGQSEE